MSYFTWKTKMCSFTQHPNNELYNFVYFMLNFLHTFQLQSYGM